MTVLSLRLERTNARILSVQRAMHASLCIPYRRKAERVIARGERVFAGLREKQRTTSRLCRGWRWMDRPLDLAGSRT